MIPFKSIHGFPLHPIGIGTWLMGSGMYTDKTHYAVYGKEEECIESIRYSLRVGQNHIDTAQIYGIGHTEEIVGQAIEGHDRKKIFIASKLWKSHIKRVAVLHAIEGMLSRLQTTYIDMVYIHGWWEEYEPLAEPLMGLCDAIDRGLIHTIGVSNFTLDQLKKAQQTSKHPISAIQNYYSLANRTKTSSELLTFCNNQHIAFVSAKPLERGLFSNPEWIKILSPLCRKYNKTSSQIALAWLIQQENVHAIPKSVKKEHIDENNSSQFTLEPEDASLLDKTTTV